jgi:6-phosphogluconate dehydrogenase
MNPFVSQKSRFQTAKQNNMQMLWERVQYFVLQDGCQRNSHKIQVVFRDFLGTEMKTYLVVIVWVE